MLIRRILFGLCLCLACVERQTSSSGTTITNVRIVDGTGAAAYAGAIRFIGDSIVDVGPSVAPAPRDSVVDGHGLTLAP
ncbi:MAG: D-aminoacylase, partial [Gemmatimonadaceae bacterium]